MANHFYRVSGLRVANYFYPVSGLRVKRVTVLRVVLVLAGLFSICYIERNSKRTSSALSASSCPSCYCDCLLEPTLSLPLDFINSTLTDCSKDDPETITEMKKSNVDLLSEERMLQESVIKDNLQRKKSLIMNAKRTSSHYQKEAEKCNAGVETCEEAREKAEADIVKERKLTALWMRRARQYGWKDDPEE